jgi:hypothetical protein
MFPDEEMKKALRRILGERAYEEYIRAEVRALVALGAGRVVATDEAECAAIRLEIAAIPDRQPEPAAVEPPRLEIVRRGEVDGDDGYRATCSTAPLRTAAELAEERRDLLDRPARSKLWGPF